MKKDRTRPEPGDVFRVPLGDGRSSSGQVMGSHMTNQHYVVVFDVAVPDEGPVLPAQLPHDEAPLFAALVLDTLFESGEWQVVGHKEVDPGRHLPAYRVSMAADEWYAESFDGTQRRIASALEIESLPLRSTLSAAVLRRAARAHAGLEPWLEVFDRVRPSGRTLSRDLFPG